MDASRRLAAPVCLLVCSILSSVTSSECDVVAEHLVYSFANRVGGGNFTYFKLLKEGVVHLQLVSGQGDADIYVSSVTMSPDYRSYERKSATCGVDIVEIPVEMARPIGIGVFGCPNFEESEFELAVYADDSSDNEDVGTTADDEESLLWSVFIGILKILLDVLI